MGNPGSLIPRPLGLERGGPGSLIPRPLGLREGSGEWYGESW